MGSTVVTFITLFMSLTTGVHPVEVAVTGPVVAVEIRIDDQRVGVMRGPRWKANCDFGVLRPLLLEAVALDSEGVERGRARQIVNLPRHEVETTIVLERGDDGLARSARVLTQSARGLDLVAFHVTLDGAPLDFKDPENIPLPPSDPEAIHFLSARADYAQGVVSHAEVSFGGSWAGETSTDLTAVPVKMPKEMKRLRASDLVGRFTVRGRAVPVVAVEKAPASLVVVMDRTAGTTMESIQTRRIESGTFTDAPINLSAEGKERHALGAMQDVRPSDAKVRTMATCTQTRRLDHGAVELFPMSPPYVLSRDAIMMLMAHEEKFLPRMMGPQKISDAVAVAGLFAAGTAGPRAVLLVLGSNVDSDSVDPPSEVRKYLESINVPLFVWRSPESDQSVEWGTGVEISRVSVANTAKKLILQQLDRQRVVWLDGSHLPNQIELSPGSDGVEIAR